MSDDNGIANNSDQSKCTDEEKSTEASCSSVKDGEKSPGVRKKHIALGFGVNKKSYISIDTGKKKKTSWTSKLNGKYKQIPSFSHIEHSDSCSSCICTALKKSDPTLDEGVKAEDLESKALTNTINHAQNIVETIDIIPQQCNPFDVEDWDELARQERAKEIEEGIDPPPGFQPHSQNTNQVVSISDFTFALSQVVPYPYIKKITESALLSEGFFKFWEMHISDTQHHPVPHSRIDYVHCLVPDLFQITNCSFYWGKMDRYEAEKLLDRRPEGTFLLRDSAQEEFLFSVSFRRYGRTLHARIEQWNHKFSFDSHDPGVFSSCSVCGLIEHYKDPSCCMFFEPMLILPFGRSFVFSLQHMCRSVISSSVSYDGINMLNLPRKLKYYLKEYHYKQRVRVRCFDVE